MEDWDNMTWPWAESVVWYPSVQLMLWGGSLIITCQLLCSAIRNTKSLDSQLLQLFLHSTCSSVLTVTYRYSKSLPHSVCLASVWGNVASSHMTTNVPRMCCTMGAVDHGTGWCHVFASPLLSTGSGSSYCLQMQNIIRWCQIHTYSGVHWCAGNVTYLALGLSLVSTPYMAHTHHSYD